MSSVASVSTKRALTSLSVSPKQSHAALASGDHVEIHSLRSSDANDGIKLDKYIDLSKEGINFTVTDVCWSRLESDLVAASTTTGMISAIAVDRGEDERSIKWDNGELSSRAINRISWHPTERKIIASAGQNSNIKLWDIRERTNSCINTFTLRKEPCRDVQISPTDPNKFAAIFENGGQCQ